MMKRLHKDTEVNVDAIRDGHNYKWDTLGEKKLGC